jgi:hypothetical protein
MKKLDNKFLDPNENEDTIYQTLWDTAKAVWRRKFIATSAHIRKLEEAGINNLITHPKLLEKQEQANSKSSRWKEIVKIRREINELDTKEQYNESMKQK